MNLLIYPGMHGEALTRSFVGVLRDHLPTDPRHLWVLSAGYSSLSPLAGLSVCWAQAPSPAQLGPLSVIAFSAGVVGAIQMLQVWQMLGGSTACLIALDGWGVPLSGDFPILRISHDRFTALSSCWLSPPDTVHFHADPAVNHLTLWKTPDQVTGRYLAASSCSFSRQPDPVSTNAPLTVIDCIVQALIESSIARIC
jgi:hypothetical protein